MPPGKEGWLARWSRLKLTEKTREAHARVQEPKSAGACAEPPQAIPAEASASVEGSAPDLADLDAESDYSPFLRQDVRPEVRSAALRKLWSSDPLFSQTDGLQDYAGDFTDSATVPSEPVATAYRIGWGVAGPAAVEEDGRKTAEPEQSGGGRSEAGEAEAGEAEADEAEPRTARGAERPQCVGARPTGQDEPKG